MMKDEIVIASACRTPVGSFGGSFMDLSAASLGRVVITEAIKRAGIQFGMVNEVILGCVLQAGMGQNIARQASIMSGIPVEVPSMTINMVCGSGLKSVCLAAQSIMSGDGDIIVAGGTENMSQAPYLQKEMRWGAKMGDVIFVDSMIYDALTDVFNQYHMGITAENIAERYNITRQEQDMFAEMSQQRAEKAQVEGLFREEIIPVRVELKKNESKLIEHDEHIRYGTTLEKLSLLKPAFKKDGTVTAGNASGINDGAAALVLMSGKKAKLLGIKPLAKILSYASSGVDPSIMGMGPVESCRSALNKAKLSVADIGLVESNEAFAAQSIAVTRELGLNIDRVNVNGNINVSRFGNRIPGCGGFIDISQNAREVFFLGTFTTSGLEVAVEEGRLRITREGKVKKFINQVEQITFSGLYAQKTRQKVLYITERAVFRLSEKGLMLIEIAPGIDLQRDILDQMEFRPIVPDHVKEMDHRLFRKGKMKLNL